MCGMQAAVSWLAGLAAVAAAPRQLELRVCRAERAPADAVVRGCVGQVASGDLSHSGARVDHRLADTACRASRVRPRCCACRPGKLTCARPLQPPVNRRDGPRPQRWPRAGCAAHLTWWGGSRSDTSDTVSVARMEPPMDAKMTAIRICVKLCDRPYAAVPLLLRFCA